MLLNSLSSERIKEMIFAKERRSLLAKTIMDLVKILGASALATSFFKSMPVSVRIGMAVSFVACLWLGVVVQPEDKDKTEE